MKKLSVLTFADKHLGDENLLKKSCADLGQHLEVLLYSPWTQNAIKLKLLNDFLSKTNPDGLLLVVDALDVILLDDAATIVEKFDSFDVDILISAESNYMFKHPTLWVEYFIKYPKQPTVYNFLNSGSYMGRAKHLKVMLETMQRDYRIDLGDEKAVLSLRSDQYLLHRFFVDNYHKEGAKLKVALDSQQLLLGCTGGRFCIRKFPDHSKTQAFLYFKIERNLVKPLMLHKFHSRSKDYEFRSGRFYNLQTNTTPSVMHLPGTWKNFGEMLSHFFSNTPKRHPTSLKRIVAEGVSYFSYASSVVLSLLIIRIRAFFQ